MMWTVSCSPPCQIGSKYSGKNSFFFWNPSWQQESVPTLGGGVEVPGLGIAQEVVFVVGEAAEEERTADQDNRGRPPKAVGPVIDVIDSGVEMKGEGLGVLHGVNYQGDDLEHS